MKYILALLMLIATPVKALDIVQVPAQCGPLQEILETLSQEYQEQPIWLGQGISNGTGKVLVAALWTNMQTQSWSFMIADNETKTACLYASGKTFVLETPDYI